MATLVVGDIHLKATLILPEVDAYLEELPAIDRVVFTDDICDEWDVSDRRFETEVRFFADWVIAKRKEGYAVDAVYGNHDFQYLSRSMGPGTHASMFDLVNELLPSLGFQIAHVVDGLLVTHAGLTRSWTKRYVGEVNSAEYAALKLNAMLRDWNEKNATALYSAGKGRGGRALPGPLWADRHELVFDAMPGLDQIVGRSPVPAAFCELRVWEEDCPRTNLWFCDTFSLTRWGQPIGDGTMLLVEYGAISVA